MAVLTISWKYTDIETSVSNASAYVASTLAQTGEVNFDNYTLTGDNKNTFLRDAAGVAVDSLYPHFGRVISDSFVKLEGDDTLGFEFTPRIEDGAYSKADLSYVKKLCEQHIVYHILKGWYAIKGVTAMRDYFIASLANTDKELDEMLVRFIRPVRRRGVSIRNVTTNVEGDGPEVSLDVDVDYSNLCEGSFIVMTFYMSPVNGVTLSECNFKLQYYTNSIQKSHTINKSDTDVDKKSDNEYQVVVDTSKTGYGTLKCLATIDMVVDGYAKPLPLVKDLVTNITIDKKPE